MIRRRCVRAGARTVGAIADRHRRPAVLDHGGVYTTYSHNQRALVEAGEVVRAGQRIAELGDEGYSGLPHLHLEKVVVPWTGDWRQPFTGCTGYVDPGADWRWW